MAMKKYHAALLIVLLACSILCIDLIHAAELKVGQMEVLYGVIEKRGWKKDIESYCQGGSEYYVLKMDDGREIALDSTRDPHINQRKLVPFKRRRSAFENLIGKRVMAEGQRVQIQLSQAEHCLPGKQCPEGAIKCSWFRVLKISEE